jgi:hypothetical protein
MAVAQQPRYRGFADTAVFGQYRLADAFLGQSLGQFHHVRRLL